MPESTPVKSVLEPYTRELISEQLVAPSAGSSTASINNSPGAGVENDLDIIDSGNQNKAKWGADK